MNTGKHWKLSEETKHKISEAMLGKQHRLGTTVSVEAREKISVAMKGNKHCLGTKNHTIKHTEEAKKKMSVAKRGKMTKENHPRWITDRSKLAIYGDDNVARRSTMYIYWARQIKNRDGLKCKIANADCSGRLEAHHILGYKEHPELRYEINNGITLCHFHHPRKRAEEAKLSPYFQELVMNNKN